MPFFNKERRQRMCEVVFSMTPKKLPKMVLINILPTKAVNAYPLLCSLVLVIQVEWLMTFLFIFNFNRQPVSSNNLTHHPPNFIPSKVS